MSPAVTAVLRFQHECGKLCPAYGKIITLRQPGPKADDTRSYYLLPSPRCHYTHTPLRQLSCEWKTDAA